MQFSMQKLNQEGHVTLYDTLSFDFLQAEVGGLLRLGPIQGTVEVMKVEPHLVEVKGEQSSMGTFQCSRCLIEFSIPLIVQWVEQFTDVRHRAKVTEEDEIHFVEGDVVNLDPYLREAFLLHLPLAPICREECRGLCTRCGINQNIVTCKCQLDFQDPRLIPLQNLLKENRVNE
jgi:uncharacterized protein